MIFAMMLRVGLSVVTAGLLVACAGQPTSSTASLPSTGNGTGLYLDPAKQAATVRDPWTVKPVSAGAKGRMQMVTRTAISFYNELGMIAFVCSEHSPSVMWSGPDARGAGEKIVVPV